MKKRGPEDEQLCIAVPNQLCSKYPLDIFTIGDNSSNNHTALHNMGLIQDSKTKVAKESLIH